MSEPAIPAQGGQDTAGIDLAAIRARCDAVPPGPWEVWRDPDKVPAGRGVVAQAGDDGVCITDDLPIAEAEFIAAARSDLPAVLDLAERLTAENQALREQIGDTGTYDRVLERAVTAEQQISQLAELAVGNEALIVALSAVTHEWTPDDGCRELRSAPVHHTPDRVLADLGGSSGDNQESSDG